MCITVGLKGTIRFIFLTSMCPCIANAFSSITNKMQRYTSYLFLWNALQVSGGSSAHHQQLKNCIDSIGYFVKFYCYMHCRGRDGTLWNVLKVSGRSSAHHQELTKCTWCGRKVMRLATLCTNRQCCCLPLHMAVGLTPAVDSAQVWSCYSCCAIVESVWSEVVFVRCVTKIDRQMF